MARKKSNKQTRANNAVLPVMRPDAAGIDIGATEIFVPVPADRANGKPLDVRICNYSSVGRKGLFSRLFTSGSQFYSHSGRRSSAVLT
jgi:hypothetical protein